MIHNARTLGTPIVDATAMVAAVHQNHDYGHLRGGHKAAFVGVEVERNWQILGPDFVPLTIDDATFILGPAGPRPALDPAHLLRRVLVYPALSPRLRPSVRVARWLFRAAKRAVSYWSRE
jgi:hypothetical protein